VCTAQSRQVCVFTAQSRHCVCTAQSREDKHCIKLPDDGSLVIRNMLEQF